MIFMDGRKIAKERLLRLKEEVKKRDKAPTLAVVWVGDDEVSGIYVEGKKRALEEIGVDVKIYKFVKDTPSREIEEKLISLSEDGIIVQLPLPRQFDAQKILDCVPPQKDVDLLSETSLGKFYSGKDNFLPPVVAAISILLQEYNVDIEGRVATVLGTGRLVGKPVSFFLTEKEATVCMINKHTKDIPFFTKNSDLIISGTGVPSILKGEMIKEGAVVIDAGTSNDDGKIKGDVEEETVSRKASLLAPVPGGVGPLVIYALACNLLNHEY